MCDFGSWAIGMQIFTWLILACSTQALLLQGSKRFHIGLGRSFHIWWDDLVQTVCQYQCQVMMDDSCTVVLWHRMFFFNEKQRMGCLHLLDYPAHPSLPALCVLSQRDGAVVFCRDILHRWEEGGDTIERTLVMGSAAIAEIMEVASPRGGLGINGRVDSPDPC